MKHITALARDGRELTFSVRLEDDNDHGHPWEDCEGHGPVTDWENRNKRPGELILNTSHGSKRFYDFAEACRIALRDGWDHVASRPEPPETPRQKAARAARADFEFLEAYCQDQWGYVGVVVTLLDDEGEETDHTDSLWGVENFGDFARINAQELADALAASAPAPLLRFDGHGLNLNTGETAGARYATLSPEFKPSGDRWEESKALLTAMVKAGVLLKRDTPNGF